MHFQNGTNLWLAWSEGVMESPVQKTWQTSACILIVNILDIVYNQEQVSQVDHYVLANKQFLFHAACIYLGLSALHV